MDVMPFEKSLIDNPAQMFGDDTVIFGLDLIYCRVKNLMDISLIVFDKQFDPMYWYTSHKPASLKNENIIIFLHNSHFVCCFLKDSVLSIFDSLYSVYTDEFEEYFKKKWKVSKFYYSKKITRQQNGHDCGAHALMIAKDLSMRKSPESVFYSSSQTRKHVLSCLDSSEF